MSSQNQEPPRWFLRVFRSCWHHSDSTKARDKAAYRSNGTSLPSTMTDGTYRSPKALTRSATVSSLTSETMMSQNPFPTC